MNRATRDAIDHLAADARSGASEMVPRLLDVLRRTAREDAANLPDVGRAVVAAQPSMAPFWNAVLAAFEEAGDPGVLARFDERWRRSGAALARHAVSLLAPGRRSRVHVTTCSFSGSVAACLRALGRVTPLTVACAEGRPSLEGRRLADALASDGIDVEFYADAALGDALWRKTGRTDAVLVGADAVAPAWFINKCGTGLLAAGASRAGVPFYVAATRDKFVDDRVAGLLRIEAHEAAEIWPGAPDRVTVCNAYFEQVPIDMVSAVITDAGVLGGEMIAEACRASGAGVSQEAIDLLR